MTDSYLSDGFDAAGGRRADAVAPCASADRGCFVVSESRNGRERRLQDLWERAARGELLLSDVPEPDRWDVRMFHAEAADFRDERISFVVWPAGYVDPFAGQDDGSILGPDVEVRFADESPDREADPEAWEAFWYGPLGNSTDDVAELLEWLFDVTPVAASEIPAPTPEALVADEQEPEDGSDPQPIQNDDASERAWPETYSVPADFRPEDATPPEAIVGCPAGAAHRFVARWLGAASPLRWRTKVAVGPDGSVWQTIPSDELRRYDRSGMLTGRWGGSGDGPGEFRDPIGLAAHPDGTVFVADRSNTRVQRFGPDGVIDGNWVQWDTFDPIDVAVTPDGGEVLVVDLGWNSVFRFRPDGSEPVEGDGLYRCNDGIALAISPDGERRYLVGGKGAWLEWESASQVAMWEPPAGLFDEYAFIGSTIEDVEAAPDGTVYVVDEAGSRVFWLDPDGGLLDEIVLGALVGSVSDPAGSFPIARPSGVAAARHGDGVRVYVTLHDGAILVFERPNWTDSGER